jgi:hypothetical protein
MFQLTAQEAISKPVLSPEQRNTLRYELQNLSNEMELLIRNQKSNEADIRRQEMDFSVLKVYERIPFTRDIKNLNQDLRKSASTLQIKVLNVHVTHYSKMGKKIPLTISARQPPFHFSQDQLVEAIYFIATVNAPSQEAIKHWIQSWPTEQMRLVEPDYTEAHQPLIHQIRSHTWEVNTRAFRFRNVHYPTIIPRKAKALLPRWAQKSLFTFANQEPLLWNLVTQIEALSPEAKPHYRERGQFYLNDDRMNFFLSKLKNIAQTGI